ncbi:MAG: hypothetical protein IJC99_00680 [Clostridia bacterium]|nr:hypothetical protein [Clostridia bacterium]
MKKIHIFLLSIVLSFSLLFTSVGYARITKPLYVGADIHAAMPDGIFISDVTLQAAINAAEQINSYAQRVLNTTVTLDNSDDASVSYTVKFFNNAEKDMVYIGTVVHEDAYDNDGIIFTVSDVQDAQVIKLRESLTLTLTFSYKNGISANRVLNSMIGFQFGEIIDFEEEEEQEKEDGTFVPGESYNTLVMQLLTNYNRYGLNDSHKGHVVHNTLKQDGIIYRGTHSTAGNLDKFYEALQIEQSQNVDYALQYISDTEYIAYLFLRTDSARDAIKVYKQYLTYDEATKQWVTGVALLGYAPTAYIDSVNHYAILPEDWQPGALPSA